MLLQIIYGNKGRADLHPIAVSLDNVMSVSWVDPRLISRRVEANEHYSVVTFKQPIVIGVDSDNNTENNYAPKFVNHVFVTGHFQDVAIDLGLDTSGRIAYDVASQDT